MSTIAVDAMGSDFGPSVAFEGMAEAFQVSPELRFRVFGNGAILEDLIATYPSLARVTTISHASETVTMRDSPQEAAAKYTRTSMGLAIAAVAKGDAHAIVSAGSTGALGLTALRVLGRYPKAALAMAAILPTQQSPVVLLDVGAFLEPPAQALFQFAVMGEAIAQVAIGRTNPRIGLMNVGSEMGKGPALLQDAYRQISESRPHTFHGFIEGTDIFRGDVDVIVTRGLEGNILLKTVEGTVRAVSAELTIAFAHSFRTRLAYLLARGAFKDIKKRMSPSRHNGAILTGLKGVVVKAHGSSNAVGFASAIQAAKRAVSEDLVHKITSRLSHS